MATLVATTDPTTGTIRVDAEQTIARDTFTRVVVNSWGSADTGQAYTHFGAAAAFQVNGTTGQHIHTATNTGRTSVLDTNSTDQWIRMDVSVPALASGTALLAYAVGRFTDADNFYMARVGWTTGATITITLRKRVLAVETNLVSLTVPNLTHVAGTVYTVEFQVNCHDLKAKLWQTNLNNPPDWQVEASDFDLTSGDFAGARSVLDVGSTNVTPFTYSFDNLSVAIGQPIRIWRVTTDGVRTEMRGSPVNTLDMSASANTATATMWDNEAPFDTNVFYEMTSACDTDVLATSNTVNLSSGGDGWLRDPVDPTRNLRISMDGSFDDCVDQDVLVFSGLGSRVYENASGVFDHIDAARPITVSQTRKNYASVLSLTSFSLDDIDGVEDILADGRVLSLSLPMTYGWAHRTFGTDHITIFDVTQSLFGVDQGVTARAWEIPFRLSDPPVDTSAGGTGGNGIGGGDATYDALAASALGVTYANLTASGQTYLQVAQGVGY